jgi:hypothetical protein
MKVDYLPRALKALGEAPAKVFQTGHMENDLRHPSLHAKKYDESRDR